MSLQSRRELLFRIKNDISKGVTVWRQIKLRPEILIDVNQRTPDLSHAKVLNFTLDCKFEQPSSTDQAGCYADGAAFRCVG